AARAIEGCPARQRTGLAERVFDASSKEAGITPENNLRPYVVPWFSRDRIKREFQKVQKIEYGSGISEFRRKWETSPHAIPQQPPSAVSRFPDDWVREAFQGLEALTDNQRARALIIAAPGLSGGMFAAARNAARTLEGGVLPSNTIYAL